MLRTHSRSPIENVSFLTLPNSSRRMRNRNAALWPLPSWLLSLLWKPLGCQEGNSRCPEQRFPAEREQIPETGVLLSSGHRLVSDYSTSHTPQGKRNCRRKRNEVFMFGPTKEGILSECIRRPGARNQRTIFYLLAQGQLRTYKLGDTCVSGREQVFLSFEWRVTETGVLCLKSFPIRIENKPRCSNKFSIKYMQNFF